jgi:transcriptional regulator with XRE-family HTH domain
MSREKVRISTEIFSRSLLSLREREGETQEGMARRLGCNLRAYQRWEHGESAPRAQWLMKILALFPDQEQRALLDAAASAPSKEHERKPRVGVSNKTARLTGVTSLGIEALSRLAEAAAKGSPAAKERLKRITDQLVRLAGELQRRKDTQK